MVELNHRDRTIKVKIAYYGPALGGKTTNLHVLHHHALAARKGELLSVNSAQDRTILFDLLPLRAAGFRGFDLHLQLLAVPGQAMYGATRRLVLKGADAVVFVANSAADRWEENIQSFREMTQNLISQQLDPSSIPLVLQYNKRDLPETTALDLMERALNARRVEALPAVAVRGEGVLETFANVLLRTMQDLASRYRIVDPAHGQSLGRWTQQAILGMFGASTISAAAAADPHDPSAAEPARRSIRVALSEEARVAVVDGRADALAESYVQASTQLTSAVVEVREELQAARRRLDDLQQAVTAAQEVLAGRPLEPVLGGVLARMAAAGGSEHASFLLPEGERSLRVGALRGLAVDPLLRTTDGVKLLGGRLLDHAEPRLHLAAEQRELAESLEGGEPAFAAVVSVPVRTPGALQGLALLYYTADAVLPRDEALAHLAVVSRALSASLELARVLETARGAERSLQLALAGAAAVRGLGTIVTFILELRDRLSTMRRRPDAPPWILEEFAQLAPPLAGSLSAARSLLAFSRGEIHREQIALRELLAELEGPSLSVELAADAEAVSGDAVLLRLALSSLVDWLRGVPSPDPPPKVLVRATADAGRVDLQLSAEATPPAGAARRSEADLLLVARIAELHGGAVVVDDVPGAGPRYTLRLPLP